MSLQIIRRIIRSFLIVANILAALCLIAAAFSDRISPEQSLLFAYLGLVFPIICLVNICFAIYWLFSRQWKALCIPLCAFALAFNTCRQYFPIHFRSPIPKDNVIKILTYNVMGFAYTDPDPDAPNKIVQYIARSQADIVCLQEYFVFPTGDKRLTPHKLANALDMYPYVSVIRLKNFDWGLAVYSKFPITQSRQIDYPSQDNGSAIHRINIHGKTLTLINNHLESFKLTSKDKIHYADFIKSAGFNTDALQGHIRQKLGPAFRIRAKQAQIIAREIRQCRTDYLIVCGDFNDTPISFAHRTLQGDLADAFANAGCGLGITYNKNLFWFRIDHILHSDNLKALNCTVDHFAPSDHYPLYAYFLLAR